MLTTSTGKTAPSFQQAGSLQALASLGMAGLAVPLVELRWESDDEPLDAQAALAVLDCVWRQSNDSTVKAHACSVLRVNVHKLIVGDDVFLPASFFDGSWARNKKIVRDGFIAAIVALLSLPALRDLDEQSRFVHSSAIHKVMYDEWKNGHGWYGADRYALELVLWTAGQYLLAPRHNLISEEQFKADHAKLTKRVSDSTKVPGHMIANDSARKWFDGAKSQAA